MTHTQIIHYAVLAAEVFIGCWLAVLVHECGHWLSAAVLGFDCKECRVGPAQWVPEKGWKFINNFAWYATAHVKVVPRNFGGNVRWRFVLVFISGPLANLVAGISTAFLLRDRPQPSLFAGTFCMVNLLLLANLIPLSAGFHASDGKNILRLVFDPKGTAKRLFITEYLQTIPLIRDSLATENWLEAQSLATALLKKAPDDHSCKELQEALHHAVAIAQQRLDAETKPDPED